MTMVTEANERARLNAALKQAERLRSLSIEILWVLNEDLFFVDAIRRVVVAIKRAMDFDAVGIRLRKGEDYPYCAYEGFSSDFLLTEDSLTARSRAGDICRDAQGKVHLECTCGLVISGRADPTSSTTTPAGSFWINRGAASPGFPTVQNETRANPRDRCLDYGFCSMALIPIRAHHEVVGLLQLNSLRQDSFTLETVQFFEGLAAGIGLAATRKQADEALSANKAKLELALASSNMGIWRWEIEANRRYFDAQTCRLLGLDSATFGGTADEFFAAVHPDDRESIKAALRRSIEAHALYESEYRAIWRDGSTHHVSARGRCIRDIDGHPTAVNGVVWAVTERRQEQEALRRSEAQYRLLFEMMTEGFALHEIICDTEGKPVDYRYLDVNPAFERITGIKAADVIGRTVRQVLPDAGASRIESRGNVALTGEPIEQEGYDEALKRHFRAMIFSPQRGQFATLYEDITARKVAEAALREQHAEMERFTYSVSHDLKSPLVTIQTFLAYLEQDLQCDDRAAIAKDTEFIRTASDKMSQLLDELLKLSRVGCLMNPPEEISLVDVVNQALSLVAGRIAARGVAVEVSASRVTLFGNSRRLVELYQNLLDNAAKFMGDQRDPRVEVGVESDQGRLVLFVRDNGKGFAAKHKERLFGLFEQLEPSAEGSGIGLTLVSRIVQTHGGKIWAESPGCGEGATFRFTLAGTRLTAEGATLG